MYQVTVPDHIQALADFVGWPRDLLPPASLLFENATEWRLGDAFVVCYGYGDTVKIGWSEDSEAERIVNSARSPSPLGKNLVRAFLATMLGREVALV